MIYYLKCQNSNYPLNTDIAIENFKFKILIRRREGFDFNATTHVHFAYANTHPHLHMLTYSRLVYQSFNYHAVLQLSGVSGISALILYYFKCFYGIQFHYHIQRVVRPCSIIANVAPQRLLKGSQKQVRQTKLRDLRTWQTQTYILLI